MKITPWIIPVLALNAVPAFCSVNVEQILGEMDFQTKNIQSIKFDFHQKIQFANDMPPSEVQGEAIFAKSGKFKIQKIAPEEQLTVSDGKKVWIYTPAYNQAWQGGVTKWSGMSIFPKGVLPLDNFASDLKKQFNVRLDSKTHESSGVWLLAEPKDPALGYKLQLCVSTQSWLPIKTVFESESAQIITDLSNTSINSSLAKNVFQFQPPKGTDVIPLN